MLLMFSTFLRAEFTDNLRWSLDASARFSHHYQLENSSRMYALGLDTHKVFNHNYRDIGFAVAQLYWTKLSNQQVYPFMFDSADDDKFIVREAHINYTAMPLDLPNIRLGHFTLPFGLESRIDTNGRLLDYHHGRNLGTKLDWGIGLNKVLSRINYSLSYTMGGKDDPKSRQGSGLFTGRIGSLDHYDFVIGLSFYHGKLDTKDRQRLAVDMQYYYQSWGFLAELAVGTVADQDENYYLLEVNKLSINEQWKYYVQYMVDDKQSAQATQRFVFAGIQYQLDNHWYMSGAVKKRLSSSNDQHHIDLLQLQIRYRY